MPLANVKMPTLGGLENRAAPPGPMLRGAGQAALERESHRDGGPGRCGAAWDTPSLSHWQLSGGGPSRQCVPSSPLKCGAQ